MLRKIFRALFWLLLVFVAAIVVFLVFSIAPVDRTPASDFDGYHQTFSELDKKKVTIDSGEVSLVGFSKVNLTPSEPVALAGYGNRKGKHYTRVADSIYVRTIVIDNGLTKVAIVSADLLLIPPMVTEALKQRLSSIGWKPDQVFLGATHTHNSIGNWGEGAAGFIYGSYEETIVEFITSRIIASIWAAEKNKLRAILKSGKIAVPQAVDNRLIKDGPEDPFLRVLEAQRSDSSKLIFLTYTAHATCLYSKDFELSRDYPGKVVDEFEKHGYTFAMFMAGAVGSHKPAAPEFGWPCFDWMAEKLTSAFFSQQDKLREVNGTELSTGTIELHLSDPQVKVTPNLKVRAWLFRTALGEHEVEINALRIGSLLLLGVPADFSGEFNASLDSLAARKSLQLITTSFNGGYVGYLTPEKYYDNKYFETQLMNWYAPGTGEFVRDVMGKWIGKQPIGED